MWSVLAAISKSELDILVASKVGWTLLQVKFLIFVTPQVNDTNVSTEERNDFPETVICVHYENTKRLMTPFSYNNIESHVIGITGSKVLKNESTDRVCFSNSSLVVSKKADSNGVAL